MPAANHVIRLADNQGVPSLPLLMSWETDDWLLDKLFPQVEPNGPWTLDK